MQFQIVRGANDSAPIDEFEFFVSLKELTSWNLLLKVNFTNPLSISIGKQPDILITTIIDPRLFISRNTGKTLVGGTRIVTELPR